ncbi:MAG: hypothetical protein EAS52_24545 [Parapedobacter sp.]|nr:MAG: hypothetical protein EAS52_24545 [Parapedobacter sp.]
MKAKVGQGSGVLLIYLIWKVLIYLIRWRHKLLCRLWVAQGIVFLFKKSYWWFKHFNLPKQPYIV